MTMVCLGYGNDERGQDANRRRRYENAQPPAGF